MCKYISKRDEPQLPGNLGRNLHLETSIKCQFKCLTVNKILATTKIGDTKPKDLNTMSIVSKNTSQHKYTANYVPGARHCSKCFFSHFNLLNF